MLSKEDFWSLDCVLGTQDTLLKKKKKNHTVKKTVRDADILFIQLRTLGQDLLLVLARKENSHSKEE